MPFYPKADNPVFAADAASVEDDEEMLHFDPAGPPSLGDPWYGPYGIPVTGFTTTNGFAGSGFSGAPGYSASPPKSWKADVQLPDGWYTRVSRRDKDSK